MSKILIIDDDNHFKEIVKIFLLDNGYEIIMAANGREGFEEAKNEKPDLIILDIFMPEVDGLSILIEIRKDDIIKDIPVILCTGAKSSYFEDLPEGGSYGYITKPFRMPALLEKIEKLLV